MDDNSRVLTGSSQSPLFLERFFIYLWLPFVQCSKISPLPSGAYHPVKPRTKLESATLATARKELTDGHLVHMQHLHQWEILRIEHNRETCLSWQTGWSIDHATMHVPSAVRNFRQCVCEWPHWRVDAKDCPSARWSLKISWLIRRLQSMAIFVVYYVDMLR